MFYKAISPGDDGHDVGSHVVAETIALIVIWCLLEAYALESIVDFFIGFFSKTDHLFSSLGLDWIGAPFDFIGDGFRKLRFLGNGDLKDWLQRAWIMWFATGFPMIVYRMSR